MNRVTFFKHFELLADQPDAVTKMRELILGLAACGKLTERRTVEGDGHALLKKLTTLPPERNSKSRASKELVVEPSIHLPVPSHWALTTVENTTRDTGYFCDGDWVESKDQDPNGDVRLIQLADIGDGIYRDRSSRFMNKQTAARLNCSYLKAGDILVARMPDPLGRCCRFPGDAKPAVTVVDVCILRCNVTFFDPDFLVIAINSPAFRLLMLDQAIGTTRSRISRSNLGALPIPLPPLSEQRRIVAKVDELMALCDELEERQEARQHASGNLQQSALHHLLAAREPQTFAAAWQRVRDHFHLLHDTPDAIPQLRQAILQLAVQGRLLNQNLKDEPAHKLLARLEGKYRTRHKTDAGQSDGSQKPFDLPTGWAWAHFQELGVFSRGKSRHRPRNEPTLYTCGKYPLVQTGDVARSDGIIRTSTGFYNEKGLAQSKLWPEGTMCITIAANIAETGILGMEACIPDSVVGFVPDEEFGGAEYFEFFMRTAKARLQDFAPSTAQKNINMEILESVFIPLPPLAEQKRIVARVEELLRWCDTLEAQLHQTRTLGAHLLASTLHHLLAA